MASHGDDPRCEPRTVGIYFSGNTHFGQTEERISGFKTTGDWGDVIEHGERNMRVLMEVGIADDSDLETALEQWGEWRPKAHERLEDDVNEKTAQQPTLKGEKAREPVKPPTRASRLRARNLRSPTRPSKGAT